MVRYSGPALRASRPHPGPPPRAGEGEEIGRSTCALFAPSPACGGGLGWGPAFPSVQDALGPAVVPPPVAAVEMVQAHRAAGAGGVHEAALADIDADVAHLRAAAEEHQVGGGELARLDLRALVGGQVARGARQAQ